MMMFLLHYRNDDVTGVGAFMCGRSVEEQVKVEEVTRIASE